MLLDVETPDLKNSRCAGDISGSSSGLILGTASLPVVVDDAPRGTVDGACEWPMAAAKMKAHSRSTNSVDSNVETAIFIVSSRSRGSYQQRVMGQHQAFGGDFVPFSAAPPRRRGGVTSERPVSHFEGALH